MISDILSELGSELDYYLLDETFANTYTGPLRDRIMRLRDEAKSIQGILDFMCPLPDDFMSPYVQTDRPAKERWSPMVEAYAKLAKNPSLTIVTYLEDLIKNNSGDDPITVRAHKQLTADLAELKAAE